jgi:hypothetical protein
MRTHTYTHTHIQTDRETYISEPTAIHLSQYTRVCLCACVFVCMCVCMHVRERVPAMMGFAPLCAGLCLRAAAWATGLSLCVCAVGGVCVCACVCACAMGRGRMGMGDRRTTERKRIESIGPYASNRRRSSLALLCPRTHRERGARPRTGVYAHACASNVGRSDRPTHTYMHTYTHQSAWARAAT